ncbi:uncharacterized protein LOC103793141 isoform X3 [Callithrix jacchus]
MEWCPLFRFKGAWAPALLPRMQVAELGMGTGGIGSRASGLEAGSRANPCDCPSWNGREWKAPPGEAGIPRKPAAPVNGAQAALPGSAWGLYLGGLQAGRAPWGIRRALLPPPCVTWLVGLTPCLSFLMYTSGWGLCGQPAPHPLSCHSVTCPSCCARSIRCLRNIIHWNLISAFILRNATWFVVQLTMSPEVQQSNVAWCRLVTAAYNYFHVTNFFWMFGEGCYLHTAVVLTYSTEWLRKWVFICIGWGVPFPIIVAWAIGKLYYNNEKCWFGKRPGVYTNYIYQGPMILVLLINFIFLFNIVRILMTKLRASTTSETIQYRASSCLCSTVSSTVRSALPSGRGGTGGRTSTQSAPGWPEPCPSPPPPPVSAFTASSSPRQSELAGRRAAPQELWLGA